MLYLLCKNETQDFDAWREAFVSHQTAHQEAGLTLEHLWQDFIDPNTVFFLFQVENKERAEAFMADPKAAEAGKASGVIGGAYHFVNSAAGY